MSRRSRFARSTRRRALTGVIAAVAAVGALVGAGAPIASVAAAPARADSVVPSGFSDATIGSLPQTTAVSALPDGTVVVLTQGGTVRLARNGALLPTPALTIPSGILCTASEQGLLGFAISGDFLADHQVWLYYTTRNAAAPGGCVNRAARFTMAGDSIDWNSQVVLVDGIGAQHGNHNGGDLEIGADGYLYISVGDSGANPRNISQTNGSNPAAQDLSLLNGKILRVDRMTGASPANNPLSTDPTSVECRFRGNTPTTPDSPCKELYAWGLRNPFRFAFDPNSSGQRFFIDDVGQGTREEVDLGAPGANYGWPIREGVCPQGTNPPCAGVPAGSTFVDPITDYSHADGTFITGGAFIPNGFWPARYDGGYLFGDGGSGDIWLRQASGAVDYAAPFATGATGLTDMTFVQEGGGSALYYVTGSALRRITYALPAQASSGPLLFTSGAPTRVFDSRGVNDSRIAPLRAGTTRYIPLPVNGASVRAALVNVTFIDPVTPGYLIAWPGRTARPNVSNVNGVPGEVVANASVVPLDDAGGFLLSTYSTADVVVDLLGTFATAPGAVSAGRYTALAPHRIADTRQAMGADNVYSKPASGGLPIVRVPVAGRASVPTSGVSAVAVVVTAVGGSGSGGGFVLATAAGAGYSLNSNLNTNGPNDIRANLVVVPLGADGSIDLHLLNIDDAVVDVAGWFTDGTPPASLAGRFVSTPLTRMVDTRENRGFGTLEGSQTASVAPPAAVPANAVALVQNVTLVDTTGPGFVTPFPGGTVPVISAGNASAAGQIRAVLSFTRLGGPPPSMSFYSYMRTDLVVDVSGYFTAG
jgi:glucose/arabinose dehydrogenase